eukprot:10429507-Alexandrium_andersonii.AAC.1
MILLLRFLLRLIIIIPRLSPPPPPPPSLNATSSAFAIGERGPHRSSGRQRPTAPGWGEL